MESINKIISIKRNIQAIIKIPPPNWGVKGPSQVTKLILSNFSLKVKKPQTKTKKYMFLQQKIEKPKD